MIVRRPDDVLLATGFSVADYRAAVATQDFGRLSQFLKQRFTERYLKPAFPESGRNGFTIMAVCCLMIESLEVFRNGPHAMKLKKDHEAFQGFFAHHVGFEALVPLARDFYGHVRCGILHNAQTTGSWRIRRDRSPLFDSTTLTIEAERFHSAVSAALTRYCQDLEAAPWDAPLWVNFRETMDSMCSTSGVRA